MDCYTRQLLDGLHLHCPLPPLAPTNTTQKIPAELGRRHVTLKTLASTVALSKTRGMDDESERRQGMGCQGGKTETYLHQGALRPTYPPVTTGHSSGQPQQQQQQQQWMAPQGSSSNGEAGAVTSGRPSGRSSSNKLLHLAAPPLSFH